MFFAGRQNLLSSSAWFDDQNFRMQDNDTGAILKPGVIADFRTNRYAISQLDTTSIATAPASATSALQNCNFSDIFTFTRAGTKRVIDSTGTLTAISTDEVPWDYTNGVRQLLLEGAATNLLVRSQEFDNASWAKAAATVTGNTTVAPDGTMTADKLVEDGTNANHQLTGGATFTSGQIYTLSAYVKAGDAGRYLALRLASGTYFSGEFAVFDPASGTFNNGSISGNGSMTSIGGGWYRCTIQATAKATGTGAAAINISLTNTTTTIPSYQGDGSSGLFAWGAQIEANQSASSYIPTTSAAVTRPADSCQLSAKALAVLARTAAGIVVQGRNIFGSVARTMIGAGGASFVLRANPSAFVLLGNATVVSVAAAAPLPSFGAAGGWNGSGKALSYNGSTIATDAVAMDADLSATAYLGRESSAGFPGNGWYDRFVVYPFRPTNASIVARATTYA